MDVQTWTTISRLLEEALDLPPAARTTWLEQLGAEYERFKPRLRAMLDQALETGDDALLATLPKLRDTLEDGAVPAFSAGSPGAMVGPYRLVRQLAAGGQGSVWLADRPDGLVNRPVAIKLPIGLAYRPDLADRMARERDILASLTHPHIARLYDAGVTPRGEPFLALEYVEGTTIDRHAEALTLEVRARVTLFLQVVRAVAYAHGQLVIHRDLKPSNVLVTAEGYVRLLDFGIAKLLDEAPGPDSTLTETGGRAMTLGYASPEQVSRAPLGVATDVYSLGVMLYELLSGARPYSPARDTVAALEDAILSQDPRPPSDVARDAHTRKALAGDLDTIVLKALKKRPADRYETVSAFAEDLERYLTGRPVLARPDSRWYRTTKFVRRNALAVGAAAAVVAAVLAGAGIAVWQARVARAEQSRAESVKDFVASIFRDANPDVGGGATLTALEVLTNAQQRIETGLDTEPLVRAELLHVIGDSLLAVGEAERAAGVLAKALAERRRLLPADSLSIAETELLLAQAGQYVGEPDEAFKHLDSVEAALARSGQLETRQFVIAKMLRAQILINRGRASTPEAEAAAKDALETATRVLGPTNEMRANALSFLGTVYRVQSKNDLALEHAEQAYRVFSAFYKDPKRRRVIEAQNEYGRALFQAGRTAEAVVQMKEAAAYGDEVFPDGMDLQHLLGTLANVQVVYGEIKEAGVNLDRAVSMELRGTKLSELYVASQSAARARVHLAARQLDDALRTYQTAVEGYAKTPDRNATTQLQTEYGEVLVRLGRHGEARALLEPMAAGRGKTMTPAVRRAVWLLGEIERRERHADRALPLLTEAVAFNPTSGRSKLDRAQMQVSLGLALLDLRRLEDAERALDEARATFVTEQGLVTPWRADALIGLGRVMLAKGRPGEARPLFEQADRFWHDFDPAHPDARDAARWEVEASER
jgi:serine/threonine-protein kinase